MGKIYGRNITGLTSRSQRRLGKAIRRARMIGIIPQLSRPSKSSNFRNRGRSSWAFIIYRLAKLSVTCSSVLLLRFPVHIVKLGRPSNTIHQHVAHLPTTEEREEKAFSHHWTALGINIYVEIYPPFFLLARKYLSRIAKFWEEQKWISGYKNRQPIPSEGCT